MPGLTDTAELQVINWVTGNSATPPTAPLKMALFSTAGTESAAGTEAVGGSYARQTITFGAASGGQAANTNLVRFDNMPAGTWTHFAIYDSNGAGTRWLYAALTSSITTLAGDPVEAAIGTIIFALD